MSGANVLARETQLLINLARLEYLPQSFDVEKLYTIFSHSSVPMACLVRIFSSGCHLPFLTNFNFCSS